MRRSVLGVFLFLLRGQATNTMGSSVEVTILYACSMGPRVRRPGASVLHTFSYTRPLLHLSPLKFLNCTFALNFSKMNPDSGPGAKKCKHDQEAREMEQIETAAPPRFADESLRDDLSTNPEDKDLQTVYIMSRIEELADTINLAKKDFSPGFYVSEINVPADTNVIDPSCSELQNAEIVICDPVILGCNYRNMPKLKWAHCTWSGVESLLESIKRKPHFTITRHSHEDFSAQIAEYVMAQILNIEKNYRLMWTAQAKKSWIDMKMYSELSSNRRLSEITIGILGVGNMGSAIAKFFKPHGTTVIGFGRRLRRVSQHGDFDRIERDLKLLLSESDYIVSTLPCTSETSELLDGDILKVCIKKPVFINVGRSSIIQENTLHKALKEGWLSRIVLDVFEKEPLPSNSVLWNPDYATITPHCAAISYPQNIAKDFVKSFSMYHKRKPLENVFDWDKEY